MQAAAANRIALTLGPLLFNWSDQERKDFYARIADEAPVDAVCLGELVCSKRLPFYADSIAGTAERLQRAGKRVVLTTLALITLPRERADCAALAKERDFELEINDLTALSYLEAGQAFRVGPLVNVYSDATLRYLAARGASAVCFPPELPLQTIAALAAARPLCVVPEVWAFGRVPLAISGRCYHARLEGLTKDSCQFVCAKDPDGRAVSTVDGKEFLAVNGVQTVSHSYGNLVRDTDALAGAGVRSLRLSPHGGDMIRVAEAFRGRLDGFISPEEAWTEIAVACPGATFSNGFVFGRPGAELVEA